MRSLRYGTGVYTAVYGVLRDNPGMFPIVLGHRGRRGDLEAREERRRQRGHRQRFAGPRSLDDDQMSKRSCSNRSNVSFLVSSQISWVTTVVRLR